MTTHKAENKEISNQVLFIFPFRVQWADVIKAFVEPDRVVKHFDVLEDFQFSFFAG